MKQSAKALLIAGGGLAVLGLGVYFLTKKPAAATSTSSDKAIGPHVPSLGDPNDPSTVAYACNACRKLLNVGRPTEAAVWQQKCIAGGGQVPTSTATMYT